MTTTIDKKWVPVKCPKCRKKYATEADAQAEAGKQGRGYLNHACPRCGQSTRTIAGNAIWHNGTWIVEFKPKASDMNFDVYLLRSSFAQDEKEWWKRASFMNPEDAHDFARSKSAQEGFRMRVCRNTGRLKEWADYENGVCFGV